MGDDNESRPHVARRKIDDMVNRPGLYRADGRRNRPRPKFIEDNRSNVRNLDV